KRVGGEIRLDADPIPPPPAASPTPAANPTSPAPSASAPLRDPIFFSPVLRDYSFLGTPLEPARDATNGSSTTNTFRADHSTRVTLVPEPQVDYSAPARVTADDIRTTFDQAAKIESTAS